MGKKSGGQKKASGKPKSSSRHKHADPVDMDDEIDVFHKQRDIVPLDLNDDLGESSDDEEHPVLEDEDIRDASDDEDEDEDVEDYGKDTGLAAKIVRQMKYLKEKMPGIDDEMPDDEEDEEEDRSTWAGHKSFYHGGDNRGVEAESSDEEELQEEEDEVKRQQKEKAKSLSMADFGLEDVDGDESDQELSLEQMKAGVKTLGKVPSTEESPGLKGANKDLSSLSREEQMDAVYSSAPELVGLLAELNDALEQLETRINPVLNKAKEIGLPMDGGLQFLEANQLLLLAYCQAITFYLLLMSEGLPVNDHPVIARLVEIKGLLDKMKELDGDLPSKLEEFLKENISPEALGKFMKKDAAPLLAADLVTKEDDLSLISADTREVAEPHQMNGLANGNSSSDHPRKEVKEGRHKRKNDEVGVESTEMLRIRAALEEKLKQKGVFSFVSAEGDKVKKRKQANSRLETRDDFDDDAGDLKNGHHGPTNLSSKKLKVISGDEDIPKRDDIGERRRKHELRVLATAGVRSEEDGGDANEFDHHVQDDDAPPESEEVSDAEEDSEEDESEEEANETMDVKSAAAKAEKRNAAAPSLPEPVEGKRLITKQMEKNRGLTRKRKKLIKNPRKKYRVKHQSAEKRRKGQVVSIKKPAGPYGGEVTGINPGVSRSIRM